LEWIRKFVVGMNLCPWAAKAVVSPGALKLLVCEATSLAELAQLFDREALELRDRRSDATTILVAPYVARLRKFQGYLSAVDHLQRRLREHELEGVVQLATFHPQYQFDGTHPQDVSNWTNRSPYPMLHLLLEHDVSTALAQTNVNPDDIWRRNIETMNKAGLDRIRAAFAQVTR
jgi:hypothetical protein